MGVEVKHAVVSAVCAVALAVAAGCATGRGRIPHMSMAGEPGQLETEFRAAHPEVDISNPDWVDPPVCEKALPSDISEISRERTPCYGYCETYTLRLFADGLVQYRGQANVEYVGQRTGRLDPRSFENHAMLAEDIGYFHLADNFDCMVTDNPTVYISIVRAGVRKTIRHYAPSRTGPPRLRAFEELIDRLLPRIKWDRGGS